MFSCPYELPAVVYMQGENHNKLCSVFQTTSPDFSHVLTKMVEEHSCGSLLLCTSEMHLSDDSSSGRCMGSGDPQQYLMQMWHFCSFQT